MEENIKEKVLEFASIAKECPENLQENCFELLLSNYLKQLNSVRQIKKAEKPEIKDTVTKEKPAIPPGTEVRQENILKRDLHLKVKQFLKKTRITVDQR